MKIPEQAVKSAIEAIDDYYDAPECVGEAPMKAALTAAAPYMQGVKVKKLEWNEYDNERGTPVRWDAEASNFGVFYSIVTQHDGYRVVFDYEAVGAIGVLDSLEAAKAASQADYEKRILSALEPYSAREQALEEAARECEKRGAVTSADAIRALKSQPVADGWLPIETAPKDGTDFIGWDGKWPFRCSAGKKYVLYPHMDGGPTYSDVWDGHYYDSLTIEHPTHWIPLPSAQTGGINDPR